MQELFKKLASEPEKTPLPRFSRQNALWLFLLSAAGLTLVSFFGSRIATLLPRQPQVRELIINLLYYLPFCALAVYVSVCKNRPAAMSLRPNPLGIGATIGLSLLAILCVYFVSDVTLIWSIPLQRMGLDVFQASLEMPSSPSALVLSVFTTAAIPAVCEELVFRGAMLSGFEGGGSRRAMYVTALLFALLHGSIVGLPGHFILGLILSQLVVYSNSIYSGMVFHTVYNATIVVTQFLQRDLPAELKRPADLIDYLGGFSGVALLLVEVLIMAWVLRSVLRSCFVRGTLRGVRLLPKQERRLQFGEVLLLAAGLIICATFLVSDFCAMLP